MRVITNEVPLTLQPQQFPLGLKHLLLQMPKSNPTFYVLYVLWCRNAHNNHFQKP
jgi:hypothetical protein